jgi:Zn-dependent protease with chaperone function
MNYERLFLFVCMAAVLAGTTLAAAIVVALGGTFRRAIVGRAPRTRARLLFSLRVSPLVAGLIASIGVAAAFIRHEPRNTTEEAGAMLLLACGLTLVLLLLAARRAIEVCARTRACHRLLRQHGQQVDIPEFPIPVWRIRSAFPVAAVAGILRPRLILSSRILDSCEDDEVLAVLRHERAHVDHQDNLMRACLVCLPDPLAFSKTSAALLAEWHEAVEEAADDAASGMDERARITLAGTLVRVARMADDAPPDWMPALALFDGDNLEARVRRLLEPDPAASHRQPFVWIAGALGLSFLAAGAVWTAAGPRPLHDMVEWAVRSLP